MKRSQRIFKITSAVKGVPPSVPEQASPDVKPVSKNKIINIL